MRKLAGTLFVILIVGCLTGCQPREASYVGLNAEIIAINAERKEFVVRSSEEGDVLGENEHIPLENEAVSYIYADNETGETEILSYDDFVIGDRITLDVAVTEDGPVQTSRVQLLTQRK